MKLSDLYCSSKPILSFELFPPKTPEGDQSLARHVEALQRFRPGLITCTYGAGGATRGRTLEIIARVKAQCRIPVASHLTCVGSSIEDLRTYLSEAQQRGIDHIVALRGDPAQGNAAFVPEPGGLRHANELVTLIRREFPGFGIAVAGYPEVHQEAPSAEVDLLNLKRKVDSGADVVITQLFYRNEDFFDFRRRAEAGGIGVPIVPGILPVTNLAQIQRITQLCKAVLPAAFLRKLSAQEDADWQTQVGIEFATQQVEGLLAEGVPGVHFYVLNKSQAASGVLMNLALVHESDSSRTSTQ